MTNFKFELGEEVVISCSKEKGEVIGRAENSNADNEYRLVYKCADGRAIDQWWTESTLEASA